MAQLNANGAVGTTNATSEVEIVPSPAAGYFRMVRSLYFNNASGETVTIHVAKKVSSVNYQFHSQRLEDGYTLEFGDGDMIVLSENETIVAWLDSDPASETTWVANWGDKES